jgi:phosphoglycolate phosphatase
MKAVIFDFDGVICDSFDIAYGINKMIYENLSVEEYKDFFNGNLYGHEKVTKKASKRYFELQEEVFCGLKIEENVKGELSKLKERYELFIISSNKKLLLERHFKDNNVSVFREILGVDEGKSKIEKFKILFERYGFSAKDCVFVTDTLGDILEANKVNVKSVAVDFGFHDKERLEKGSPERIVSSFEDILLAVEEIFD